MMCRGETTASMSFLRLDELFSGVNNEKVPVGFNVEGFNVALAFEASTEMML